MAEPARLVRVGAYILCVDAHSVLLVRSSRTTVKPGWWSLPGGGLEHGEQPEDAGRRELEEETGLRATNLVLLGVHSNVYERPERLMHGVRLLYAGDGSGSLRSESSGSTDLCAWVPSRELSALDLTPWTTLAISLHPGGP
jgi:8-oxo-dGTP pyrophosphatase MutT (NUDIX family)